MKGYFLGAFLIWGMIFYQEMPANLTFVNKDSSSSLPKFEIKNGKTLLYERIEGNEVLTYSWKQVPVKYDESNNRSRHKMIITVKDGALSKNLEISYLIDHTSGKYSAMIKSTHSDASGKHVREDYFTLKP